MKGKDYQKLEDLLVKAVQSGKSETSGLVASLEKNMKATVEVAVEEQINGYLRTLISEVKGVKVHLGEQDVKIDKLIQDTTPVVEDRKTITRGGKFIIWIGGIAAAILTVLKLIK